MGIFPVRQLLAESILFKSAFAEPVYPDTAKSKGKKPRKAVAGQREMLLPISGKRAATEQAKVPAPKKADKPVRAPVRSKKAG